MNIWAVVCNESRKITIEAVRDSYRGFVPKLLCRSWKTAKLFISNAIPEISRL
jgi:hypothetical protein